MKQVAIRPVTDAERKTWPSGVAVTLEKPFVDARGSIQPLVDIPMESCVLITTKKDTVRANHFHHTDWHFCYVLSGAIEYWHRQHGSNRQAKKVMVRQGQLFFTPPMIAFIRPGFCCCSRICKLRRIGRPAS